MLVINAQVVHFWPAAVAQDRAALDNEAQNRRTGEESDRPE